MPATLTEAPVPYDQTPHRIRWTVQQCDELRDAGFLTGRYELIDGEIIIKVGQKSQHARRVRLFLSWLVQLFGAEFVMIQSTISLQRETAVYDEPEPDAVVTTKPESAYENHHPTPQDLVVVVEVSDSSLRFDLTTKAALYARAGILEYWVADITGRRIYVHRRPLEQGYADVAVYNVDEQVCLLARPDAPVLVGALLPELT